MIAKTKTRANQKCIVKRCTAIGIVSRGLCPKCYYAARYLIREGKTSWEELQKLGLAKATHAKLAESPLAIALIKAKATAQVAKARKRTK